MAKKRVIILGAGFAGLQALKTLATHPALDELQITLVNQHRWSLFSPLMPDLISGRICPNHMAYELEPFCKKHKVHFEHTHIKSIDLDRKSIETANGTLSADFIILALGCETNYHGNETFKEKIPGLKSLHEGIRIRNLIKQVIDESKKTVGKKTNIIIVGAGYTGFEVASHTALYAGRYCRHPLANLSEVVNITMVEHADSVLGNTTKGVQEWAKKLISRYDVGIKTHVTLKQLQDDRKALLTDGSVYENALLIWTAGVTPVPVCRALDVTKHKSGRLLVDSHLRLPQHQDIFTVGDIAAPIPPGHDQPLRMCVQFSCTGGRLAARNILNTIHHNPLQEFDPFDPGYVIPLGPGHALSRIMGHEMHGRIPFLLHYFMSISRSWGWQNKFAVMKDLFSELLPFPSLAGKHRKTDEIHRNYQQRITPT